MSFLSREGRIREILLETKKKSDDLAINKRVLRTGVEACAVHLMPCCLDVVLHSAV